MVVPARKRRRAAAVKVKRAQNIGKAFFARVGCGHVLCDGEHTYLYVTRPGRAIPPQHRRYVSCEP